MAFTRRSFQAGMSLVYSLFRSSSRKQASYSFNFDAVELQKYQGSSFYTLVKSVLVLHGWELAKQYFIVGSLLIERCILGIFADNRLCAVM